MKMIRLDRFLTLSLFEPFTVLTQRKGFQIPILMYHSISHDVEPGIHPYYRTVTSPEVFVQQMALLAEQGYLVIGLDTAMNLLSADSCAHHDVPAKPVVITFDDGFLDFYTHAFPILSEHGFTATVFLPTSYINVEGRTIMGRPFLTWSQVRELGNAGITFGSHSMSHRILGTLARIEIDNELRQSKETIEDRTGKPVYTFSCPFAFPEHDKNLVAYLHFSLMACGYSGAVTTRIGTVSPGDDLYCLKRIPVNAEDDISLFRAKMAGSYDWLHAAQYSAKVVSRMLGMRRRKLLVEWSSHE